MKKSSLFHRLEQRNSAKEIEQRQSKTHEVASSSSSKQTPNRNNLAKEHPSETPAQRKKQPVPPKLNASVRLDEIDKEERTKISEDLHKAAEQGNLVELTRLLSTGKGLACVNERDDCDRTPLDSAIIGQSLDAVKLLVEKGADVNSKDDDGRTPLFYAASRSQYETIKLLVEKGANMNAKTSNGVTALYLLANGSSFEAIKFLVDKGAEIDPIVEGFGTPLTIAAKFGYDKMARLLLGNGASKENAVAFVSESVKALVEGFLVDLERVSQLRPGLDATRRQLEGMILKSEKPETLPTTCKGITIGGLRRMKALVQADCEAGRFKEDKSFPDGTLCKGTMQYEELTTTDVVYRYVKDENVTVNMRLIDTGIVAPEHKALPRYFISHAWKGRFSKLLAMIFDYVEKNGLSDETAVWIDVFSVNQHGSKECSEFSREQNQADVAAFKDVVQTCIDGTLVVCDFEKCITSTRAWCLFEWDWTIFYHGREKLQFVGLSQEEARAGKIDVDKAECFMAEDKAMILREIVVKHGSTEVFNDKLKNKWLDVSFGLS